MINSNNVVAFRRDNISAKDRIVPLLEAFLYSQEKSVKVEQLAEMTGYSKELVDQAIQKLRIQLENHNRGVMLAETETGYGIVPKPEFQSELSQLKKQDQDRLTAIVDEYLYVLESRGNREGTINNYRIILENFVKFLGKPIDKITRKDIRYYLMHEKKRGNSRNTIGTKVSTIKSLIL